MVTSYPGSPTPEIANAVQSIGEERRPFYFEFSVNEKVASEVPQRKKSGYVQKHVEIKQETCRRIHDCVEKFGCTSFIRNPDESIDINLDFCIGDGSCRSSCPEQAVDFDRGTE